MEINIFGKYKIKRINNYSYISDKIGEEYYFNNEMTEEEKIINGSELMEWIIDDLKDDKTISIHFKDNEIFIEQYSPNGETEDIHYKIKPIYHDVK